MIYFSVKDDLEIMKALLHNFEKITEIEKKTRERIIDGGASFLTSYAFLKRIREDASKTNSEYQVLRTTYAKLIPRANKICEREKVSWYKQGMNAELEGGGAYQGSIFEFILNRPSDLMDIDTDVRDTINQVLGVLEYKESQEFKKLVNPFYWIREVFIFVVSLPYNILRLSGFDVDKIQEHLFARLFHLIYVIALILILVRFGLTSVVDLPSLLTP